MLFLQLQARHWWFGESVQRRRLQKAVQRRQLGERESRPGHCGSTVLLWRHQNVLARGFWFSRQSHHSFYQQLISGELKSVIKITSFVVLFFSTSFLPQIAMTWIILPFFNEFTFKAKISTSSQNVGIFGILCLSKEMRNVENLN